jgi:hypothetical protein
MLGSDTIVLWQASQTPQSGWTELPREWRN